MNGCAECEFAGGVLAAEVYDEGVPLRRPQHDIWDLKGVAANGQVERGYRR